MTLLSEEVGIPGHSYAVSWRDASGKWHQLLGMTMDVADEMFEHLVARYLDAADRSKAVQEVHVWEYKPVIVQSFDADFAEVVG